MPLFDPPATAGGTDLDPQEFLTFAAKLRRKKVYEAEGRN
jgi:hypothetical protein